MNDTNAKNSKTGVKTNTLRLCVYVMYMCIEDDSVIKVAINTNMTGKEGSYLRQSSFKNRTVQEPTERRKLISYHTNRCFSVARISNWNMVSNYVKLFVHHVLVWHTILCTYSLE